jgi:two-component system, CitB family, sensor kinase
MTHRLSLARQILLMQALIVVTTVGLGAAVSIQQARRQLDREYSERVLAIAQSVAAAPIVRQAFGDPDPSRTIQPFAESVRRATGAEFVVVANADQIRYSHPEPQRIGERLSTDATAVLTGRPFVGVETGTLGRSIRGKVPITADGDVIGVVSVGILTQEVAQRLRDLATTLLGFLAVAALLGVVGSYLLARHVKRQTFGLEPGEIAGLLEHREALLHGLREGVIAVDRDDAVTLVNDEARRLLDLRAEVVGTPVGTLDLPPRIREVLAGTVQGPDQVVLRRGRVLVVNRMPVRVRGEDVGAVATLRDRTKLTELATELDGARSTAGALRAQAHEFANRMHTVAGLIELGEHDEALGFITRVGAEHERTAAAVTDRVHDPAIAALLVAKTAAAAERGAVLTISSDSRLDPVDGEPQDVLTVVGNLVDNALDALGGVGGRVEVRLRQTPEGTLVQVHDSGPGVADDLAEEVFNHGFTTKVAERGGARGLGLALTRTVCLGRGGWVRVHNDDGAVFTALLPPAPREASSR